MKFRYFLIAIFLISVISCKKDGGSGLTIKIASVSSNIIPQNGSLSIVFNFTDNGGYAIDSIYMERIRINQQSPNDSSYPFGLSAPSYPGAIKGQVQIDLDYNFYLTLGQNPIPIDSIHNENDSLLLKFVAVDVANNRSDTVSPGLIVVQR
jgi:hypothetical protein